MGILEDIMANVKKKKELSFLSDEVVRTAVLKWANYNTNGKLPYNKKEMKILIKEVRSGLRKLSGRFSAVPVFNPDFSHEGVLQMLKSHSSTNERLSAYPWLIGLIDSLHVSRILDLGCGINPIALARPGMVYHAIDIREDNLNLIRLFFINKGIKGKVESKDLRTITQNELDSTDLTLLLKVVDLLDIKGHKNTERLLNIIPSKLIMVSFPTKTLSGKPMNHPQRGWIERLCMRLGFRYQMYIKENEIFYLIQKL